MNETRVVILPAGTGFWLTGLYPIGGDFSRAIFDMPVTVERTFPDYKGCTAEGRIVASGYKVAYKLSLAVQS